MKYEELRKITAHGVVIFSFFALLLYVIIVAVVDGITALLVLKTALPESVLKIGGVLGSGIAMIVSTALLTALGRVKGILAAGIMSVTVIAVKICGNMLLELGGYFTWNGFAGILFTVVFALIGAVVGTASKRG